MLVVLFIGSVNERALKTRESGNNTGIRVYKKTAMTLAHLFVIGPGLVGSSVLKQLRKINIDAVVAGVCDSRHAMLGRCSGDDECDLRNERNLTESPVRVLMDRASELGASSCVFVDCTACGEVASAYAELLTRGFTVVTPNKIALSAAHDSFYPLEKFISQGRLRYEATVGAGLPIISTIRRLRETGDRIIKIEGVLSGTLSYIFNSMGKSKSMLQAIREARELGFTEPDPRKDLDGMDVARKVTILARTCGMPVPKGALQVRRQSLVPSEMDNIDLDEFMAHFKNVECSAPDPPNHVKRYVGSIDMESGDLVASVVSVPLSHPFAGLRGNNNMVCIYTERYPDPSPLVIQGPGAGADVTAQGVLGDLIDLQKEGFPTKPDHC